MKTLYVLMLSFILIGCVNKNVHQDLSIRDSNFPLDLLAGKYSNKGKTSKGYDTPLLTEFLFPEFSNDDLIDTITVKIDGDLVIVKGWMEATEIIKRNFIAGKDFQLENGTIELERVINCGDCEKAGALHLGVAYNNRKLLFTDKGDVILRESVKGAFIVLFVIPMAGLDENDYLYEKITSEPLK